jgi:NAD(P)-dependent dehydrogenase (short-subunit alcohol dehydrogenase family)
MRIGYCLSLTGPLADNSGSARLAHEIWREDINRQGGLLGRPVELVCTKSMRGVNEEIFDYLPKQQAIPRIIEPRDLVGVVSFLCSSDSAFVTGQTIVADGGQVRV